MVERRMDECREDDGCVRRVYSKPLLHQDVERRTMLYRFGPPATAYGRGYLDGWPEVHT